MPDRNTFEGEEYMARLRRDALAAFGWLASLMDAGEISGMKVYQVVITAPQKTGRDYRLTLKAWDDNNQPYVCFTNGSAPLELVNVARQLQATTGLPWRDDVPYDQRNKSS